MVRISQLSCLGRAGAFAGVLSLLGCGDIEPFDPAGPTAPSTATSGNGSVTVGVSTTSGTPGDTGAGDGGAGRLDESSDGTTGCYIGGPGCPCTQGGACDPDLMCVEDICIDPNEGVDESEGECPIGAEGCACTMGGGCDEGLVCASNFCVDPNS